MSYLLVVQGHPRRTGHSREFWHKAVHWRGEVESCEPYEKAHALRIILMKDETASGVSCSITPVRDRFEHFPVSHQRRQWHPTPALLPGKSHGWRSLVGCSPWGRKESDTTERLHFHFSLGEGNGKPLQCSCLENPRDGGACWLPSMGSHRVGHDWSDLAVAMNPIHESSGQRWKLMLGLCWEPGVTGCPGLSRRWIPALQAGPPQWF